MKHLALATSLFIVFAAPAQAEAITCETLRHYASIYPRSVLEYYAKVYHITYAQRRAAYACLRVKTTAS